MRKTKNMYVCVCVCVRVILNDPAGRFHMKGKTVCKLQNFHRNTGSGGGTVLPTTSEIIDYKISSLRWEWFEIEE